MRIQIAKNAGLILVVSLCVSMASAEDWPAWRHDAERTAVTGEVLPETLDLQWSRELGTNHVAWAEDIRLQFDRTYEPIVSNNRLIVASARNNSVAAFDAATGDELWRILVAAPVRLAPFAHQGKVYFGADDSKLYCVDVESGEEVWSIHAAPADRLVLGNERLISVWPVRGGVVIHDDAAFFTVGVWPFEGCLLCKLDLTASTPRLETKLMENVSPQGHLAVTDGQVLVPGGRGLVSSFDARTLEPAPVSYSSSGGTTETHVSASGQHFFHGDAVFDLQLNQQLDFRLNRPISDGGIAYGFRRRTVKDDPDHPRTVHEFVSFDVGRVEKQNAKDRRGNAIVKYHVPERLVVEIQALTEKHKQSPRLVLKASDQLIGVWDNHLFAMTASDNAHSEFVQTRWTREFASPPNSVIAANEKLYVTTLNGTIHCFGGRRNPAPRLHVVETQAFATKRPWQNYVRHALTETPRQAHCVVIGAGSGGLVEELLRQSELELHIIEPIAERAKSLRRRLAKLGVYGTRATVLVGDPQKNALPPYLASLVVSEDVSQYGPIPLTVSSLHHVLRPYGGSMVFAHSREMEQGLRSAINENGLQKTRVTVANQLVMLERFGALPGAADWTHEYGDPSNTLMSQDLLAKAPFGVLWFGGPASRGELFFNRHYWGPGLTVVEGRMVVQGPETLSSIDIYTGELLWQKKIRSGHGPGRRGTFFELEKPGYHYTVTQDAIYLIYPETCLVLDPLTGETTKELRLPEPDDQWGKIRVWQDLLIVAVFRQDSQGQLPKAICAVNRHSGNLVWRKDAQNSLPLIAVGGEKVYCFDGYLPGFYDAWKRRGLTPKSEGYRALRAYDVDTGEEAWQVSADRVATWMAYSPEHDTLIVSNKQGVDAHSGKDGQVLWKKSEEAPGFGGHPENVWDKVILSGDRIIDQRGPGKSYDIKTGRPIFTLNPISKAEEQWQFTKTGHHCNYAIASPHLLTFRTGTAGFFDRTSNTTGRLNGFRSGCRNSLIPAGGILNAPNYAHGCSCNYNLFTSLAMVHRPDADLWTYSAYKNPNNALLRLGINLGAPGDRLDDQGTLWLEHPASRDPSPTLQIETDGELKPFRFHSNQVSGDLRWIGGSGVEGLRRISLTLPDSQKNQVFDVKLFFVEPNAETTRRFDVKLQGHVVLKDFEPLQEAGHAMRTVVRAFQGVEVKEVLSVELTAAQGNTLLCGIQLVAVQN